MKRLLVVLFAVCCYSTLNAQSFKVTLKTPNYKKGIAYLTYHMGKSLNVEDSAAVNNKGVAIFTGKRRLPGGIYSIVFPGKDKSFDFFVGTEQIITKPVFHWKKGELVLGKRPTMFGFLAV